MARSGTGYFGAALVLVLAALMTSTSSWAQTIPPEYLDTFRNLTPEQQQNLLQGVTGSPLDRSSTAPPQAPTRGTELSTQEAQRRARLLRQEDREPLIPVIKPEDTVLVQITLPERRLVTSGATDTAERTPQDALNSLQPAQLPNQGQLPTQINSAGPSTRQYLEPIELEAEERQKLQDLVELIRSRNPYRLDRDSNLTLPGFVPIPLGGLNETQATMRLSAEPALLKLDVKVVRLPLNKTGIDGLKRFGYDLFEDPASSLSPVSNAPAPADYIVGPGDQFNIQLYGNQNRTHRLVVTREGNVTFPELGPIRVAGLTYSAAKRAIEERVSRQMIGVRADVAMGDLRGITVFVLGEAKQPGSFTVSGAGTITTALFASGGIKPIGSLRDIQLKRQGAVVRHLDLYDLMIRGDNSDDAKLQAGDVVFIPPLGPTVSVDGEVKRPAIYELRGESTIEALVGIAGGLTPEADASRGSLTRVDAQTRRIVLPVNLNDAGGQRQGVQNGDVLRVARLRPQLDSGVMLDGFVHRPGPFAWREGLRLTDVIGSVDELRPNADAHYLLIRRESGPDRAVSVLSADLVAAVEAPGGPADLVLQPRDRITVFDLAPGRERIIRPILDELRLQSQLSRPTQVVRVEGRVKVPGEYPLEPNMTVRDLLRAGGNLETSAYGGTAELARYTVGDNGARRTELIEIDLASVRRGDTAANLPLRPFDYLLVKETPDWGTQESVTLKGEVRFPGTYPIRRGETLHDLMQRAGGLSALAFPRGAAFTRRDIKETEQKQLDKLAERMQSDIAVLSVQSAAANQSGASQALVAGQQVLAQLKASKAVGRMTIDLAGLMAGEARGPKDVVLRGGDELLVPRERQEVTVIGEVQGPTSHLYVRNLKRDDYINLSGGTTRKADRSRIYVVHADGSVVAQKRSLFMRSYDIGIQPGDTIVVPIDAERMPRLPFWLAVTQIIYNLAVSVAAVNSF